MARYRWTNDYERGQSFGGGGAVIGLIIATAVVFVLQMLSPRITGMFALDPQTVVSEFKFYQLFTYMFLHGGFFHIFMNLFVLYMFGGELENRWGTGRFLFYYFFSGIGAGIITTLLSHTPVVGASGAIYGLLLAFGILFPNRILLMFFIIPMKAKWAVIIFAAFEFYASMGASGDGIAHVTHLGGMLFGGILLLFWHFSKIQKRKTKMVYFDDLSGGVYSPANIDRILEKVARQGRDALSEDEKRILIKAGKYYKDKNGN